eukprot:10919059-Heterocapsa_arctica.AAC.1
MASNRLANVWTGNHRFCKTACCLSPGACGLSPTEPLIGPPLACLQPQASGSMWKPCPKMSSSSFKINIRFI